MKQALRDKIRKERKAIPANSHAEKSAAIRQKLEQLPEFAAAQSILMYISKSDEVATHQLTKDCIAAGKKVYVPKVQDDTLVICPILGWEQLKPGSFGILEPCETLDPTHSEETAKIDLILVPGIAFDPRGHRIGYGRGFYDSLLKLTRGEKIGLAFSEQIIDEIPDEEHDVALDMIITDSDIIHP